MKRWIMIVTLIAAMLWLVISVDYFGYAVAWSPILVWLFLASQSKELENKVNDFWKQNIKPFDD